MNILKKDAPGRSSSRGVAIWLLIGVFMLLIQVLLGGITRLTESGLSITEWKPITGILPPLNDIAWQAEFDKYKVTDQFKYVHQHFSLSEFKSIFFWEWLHRLWARLMSVVLIAGFIYFLLKKQLEKKMIIPIIILLILGAIQGAIGWLMVRSGLVPEKYFVGHVELATHFIAALVLLSYTLWIALGFLPSPRQKIVNAGLQKFLLFILIVLSLQLVYGAFMAGLRAAVIAPTWPDINGRIFPADLTVMLPMSKNLIYNPITIHFIHRGLAYLLFCMILVWWLKSRAVKENKLFLRLRHTLLLLVSLQVLLGILTVINSTYPDRLVWLGVSHQFTAMLLVIAVICLLYITKGPLSPPAGGES